MKHLQDSDFKHLDKAKRVKLFILTLIFAIIVYYFLPTHGKGQNSFQLVVLVSSVVGFIISCLSGLWLEAKRMRHYKCNNWANCH